jgi:cellulose synthase/poly-beta-1,6-N-acetylglucosamine synthase-like glycosyltransferase
MEIAMRIQSLNYKIANSMYSVVYTVAPNQLGPLTKQRRRWYFGMVKNLWKYRYMFSKKYGELGVMILPLAVSTIFITMIVTFYYLINGLIEGLKQASLYSSVGFDFISNFKYKSYLISLNIQKLFSEGIILFAVFFFVGMLLMLILVNKKVRSVDKPISTFISYLFFMFFYSLLFTIWWTISIVYSITHKQIKWK